MKKKTFTTSLFLVISMLLLGQKNTRFTVNLPAESKGIDIPVSIDLDKLNQSPGKSFSLIDMTASGNKKIPYQVSGEKAKILSWIIPGGQSSPAKRSYSLVNSAGNPSPEISAVDSNGTLVIRSGSKPLIQYNYHTVYPPAGIDSHYKRSGFIHPLWTPNGQELTRIQPPDHYHHYGIWNPWTHVLFAGDTVDFWNIRGRQGTVRFSRFTSKTSGPVFAEFEALHEHVRYYRKDRTEKVALNELQKVKVYKPGEGSDHFIVDFTSEMKCASNEPFRILAYRYAGLGWRATAFWDKHNMEVLTSEGKTRINTDNTNARWILSQGALPGNEYGGMLMMSHPENYNHPEPLRIWDLNANGGRGDYFANFAPTKDKDWLLEPGKTYVLRYRFVVFNGKMEQEKAEAAWQHFSNPPRPEMAK